MSRKPTRGVRNNNPGNIDRNKTKWQGMAKDQSGDARFVVFTTPQWGIRALMRTLMTYQTQYKLGTVRKIINRWAPPVENDTGAYVEAVAEAVGVGPDAKIDVDEASIALPLVKAIIHHENGYDPYPDSVIQEALHMAGVADAPPKPLVKQTTFVAQAATGVASCGAVVASVAEPVKKMADGLAPFTGSPVIERLIMVLVTAAGIATAVGIASAMLKQRAQA